MELNGQLDSCRGILSTADNGNNKIPSTMTCHPGMGSDSDNIKLVHKLRIGISTLTKHTKSLLANLMRKWHHIIEKLAQHLLHISEDGQSDKIYKRLNSRKMNLKKNLYNGPKLEGLDGKLRTKEWLGKNCLQDTECVCVFIFTVLWGRYDYLVSMDAESEESRILHKVTQLVMWYVAGSNFKTKFACSKSCSHSPKQNESVSKIIFVRNVITSMIENKRPWDTFLMWVKRTKLLWK